MKAARRILGSNCLLRDRGSGILLEKNVDDCCLLCFPYSKWSCSLVGLGEGRKRREKNLSSNKDRKYTIEISMYLIEVSKYRDQLLFRRLIVIKGWRAITVLTPNFRCQ